MVAASVRRVELPRGDAHDHQRAMMGSGIGSCPRHPHYGRHQHSNQQRDHLQPLDLSHLSLLSPSHSVKHRPGKGQQPANPSRLPKMIRFMRILSLFIFSPLPNIIAFTVPSKSHEIMEEMQVLAHKSCMLCTKIVQYDMVLLCLNLFLPISALALVSMHFVCLYPDSKIDGTMVRGP